MDSMTNFEKVKKEVLERAELISEAALDAPLDKYTIGLHVLRSAALIECETALEVAGKTGDVFELINDFTITFEALELLCDNLILTATIKNEEVAS